MTCLKCGREMEPGNAFCPGCLAEMEKHPVSPNTVVVLPSRRRAQPKKAFSSRHSQEPSQRDLLRRARRRCRGLAIATTVLALLLAGVIGLGAWLYLRPKAPPTGQNYTAIPSSSSSVGETAGS